MNSFSMNRVRSVGEYVIRVPDFFICSRSVAGAGLDAEDVHLGFKALPEIEIACSEFEPALRLLVNIEAAADLYNPSVIETNFAVVNSVFDLPFHHNIELQ